MKAIELSEVEKQLELFKGKDLYLHLETTNGAYASHFGNKGVNVGAYIRNAQVRYTHASIKGQEGSYRVGIKTMLGWIYAEGLSHWELYEGKLLLAGHDPEGRLMVALQISESPFE